MAWGIQWGSKTAAGRPPLNAHNAVLGVAACRVSIVSYGMVGPSDTLGRPWIPLEIQACLGSSFLPSTTPAGPVSPERNKKETVTLTLLYFMGYPDGSKD
jgi:hypothetical protein